MADSFPKFLEKQMPLIFALHAESYSIINHVLSEDPSFTNIISYSILLSWRIAVIVSAVFLIAFSSLYDGIMTDNIVKSFPNKLGEFYFTLLEGENVVSVIK